jgi:hypothetical protein
MVHDKPAEGKGESQEQQQLNAAATEATNRLNAEVQKSPNVARTNDAANVADRVLIADASAGDAKYAEVANYAKFADPVSRMPESDRFNIGTQANVKDVMAQFDYLYPNNRAFNQSVNDVLRV